MNRGTVMEKSAGSAVVMTPDGQFVRVKASSETEIGDEISWSAQDRLTAAPGFLSRRRLRIAYAASAAVLLFLCVALWSFRAPPVVAYVSMDVNPSLEFGLDAKERVRQLRAVNEDALAIVENIPYKGEPVERVAQAVAQKLSDSKILAPGGGEVVIASVRLRTVDEEWEHQVTEKIEQALQNAVSAFSDPAAASGGLDIETVFLPVEVRKEAEAQGISSGKMAFLLAAESGGHQVAVDELKKESVRSVASSWGGLKKVLEDGNIQKEDKDAWKKLLEQQKEKRKRQEAESSASPKSSDNRKGGSNKAEDKKGGKGKSGNGKNDDKDDDKGNKGKNGKGRGGKDDDEDEAKGTGSGNGGQPNTVVSNGSAGRNDDDDRQSGSGEDRQGGNNGKNGNNGDKSGGNNGGKSGGGKGKDDRKDGSDGDDDGNRSDGNGRKSGGNGGKENGKNGKDDDRNGKDDRKQGSGGSNGRSQNGNSKTDDRNR